MLDKPKTGVVMLNDLAWDLIHQLMGNLDEFRVELIESESGAGNVIDFGVDVTGSLSAGLALAQICMADMGEVSIAPGEVAGIGWPHVFVQSDDPVECCLFSQYAGWQIAVGEYFGMGSGPMRVAYGREPLLEKLDYREKTDGVVGVIESSQLPPPDVIQYIADSCKVPVDNVVLAVAPTASIAGNLQVVARSLETCMHKLYELKFDVECVECGQGWAPLSPVAADDLTGIGRTNDAILYGGRVTLFVHGDDESIAEIGPKVPSSSSEAYGQPFLKIFEEAGRDFYAIDPHLFSPAEVVFHNVETGNVHHFGGVNHDVLKKSFGL